MVAFCYTKLDFNAGNAYGGGVMVEKAYQGRAIMSKSFMMVMGDVGKRFKEYGLKSNLIWFECRTEVLSSYKVICRNGAVPSGIIPFGTFHEGKFEHEIVTTLYTSNIKKTLLERIGLNSPVLLLTEFYEVASLSAKILIGKFRLTKILGHDPLNLLFKKIDNDMLEEFSNTQNQPEKADWLWYTIKRFKKFEILEAKTANLKAHAIFNKLKQTVDVQIEITENSNAFATQFDQILTLLKRYRDSILIKIKVDSKIMDILTQKVALEHGYLPTACIFAYYKNTEIRDLFILVKTKERCHAKGELAKLANLYQNENDIDKLARKMSSRKPEACLKIAIKWHKVIKKIMN
ncbi:MAG: hypothetical protein ACTSPW_19420 [Promethearchaeota archaeon]